LTGGLIIDIQSKGKELLSMSPGFKRNTKYTPLQGQYLAFIYYYTKIHQCPPAEADMQKYFRVSAPSIHQMVLTLEKRGLIERVPHQARSIRLLLPREELPNLE
jgi:repressor LexA